MNTDARLTVHATLNTLVAPEQVFEIRIPKVRGKKQTASGYFDDVHAASDAVMRYDGTAAGIYLTINPVDSSLLARAANRIKAYADVTTSDHDILSRRWLPVDIDPKRPSGISATDAEHDAAHAVVRGL